MENGKRTVLFYTNAWWLRTGFGKNAKNILSYLYKTGKYNLINVCGGVHNSDPKLHHSPWKSIGGLPDNLQELKEAERDPRLHQLLVYGNGKINQIVNEHKVDIVFAIEDPWSITFDHAFWNKIPTVLWTTLDSLPILPIITENIEKLPNLWIWSNFATKELHKMGHTNVKTVHGPLDTDKFYKLTDKQRGALRDKYNISQNQFIISFVFRNQGRKSVDKLLAGYKLFKDQNPEVKNTSLLLVTHFSEGWDIPRLIKEYNINPNEVLCVYICKNCNAYSIKPFTGQDKDCEFCGAKGSAPNQENQKGSGQITISPGLGVTDEQLNEIYNLSSIYCHPMTSGGQELPIQEAQLCELVTLVTKYSCGEEMCESPGAIPLEYAIYKDLANNMFDKSATYPSSIAKQIAKCYFMKPEKLAEMGKKGRQWVLDNYSIEIIGKYIEEYIDSQPETSYNYKSEYIPRNENFQVPFIEDNTEWLKCIYKNILLIDEPGSGLDYWLGELNKGINRADVEAFFRRTAIQENQKNQKTDFADLLLKNDKKQLALVQPQSIGDLVGILGILESIRSRYPSSEWNIYMVTEPKYWEIFEGCEFIDKLLPYQQFFDNCLSMEGAGPMKGYFHIVYQPFWKPQRSANYTHNGMDLLDLEIK